MKVGIATAAIAVLVFPMITHGNSLGTGLMNAYAASSKPPENLALEPSSQEVPAGLPGNEVTMAAVNPLKPQNVAIVNFPTLALSSDFGTTFAQVAPSPPAGQANCSDDVIAFDSQGRLFWTYLSCSDSDGNGTADDFTLVVQQNNPTTGALIGSAVDVIISTDAAPTKHSADKEWMAADANPASPFKDNLYLVWCEFKVGKVLFSRSTNQGQTWSTPSGMGVSDANCNNQSHVAVAPNGDVYVSYTVSVCSETGSIVVLKDSAGGANFAAGTFNQKTIPFPPSTGTVTGNTFCGAQVVPKVSFWMVGSRIGYVVPDTVRPGNIYVFTTDDPNNDFTTGDAGDVVMATSTNYGATWVRSTISHAPAGTLQVFPVPAIDELGNLAVHWYDTRSGLTETSPVAGNLMLDLYGTVSTDGGATWTNDFRINQLQFNPDAGGGIRIGEYNGVAAANGIGYAAFTGNTFSSQPPNPATNANGQQTWFSVFSVLGQYPDSLEPNNAIAAATNLGAHNTYSESDLTINSATDEDFFKITALKTGALSVSINFNSRVANLTLQIQDKSGNPIGSPTVVNNPSYLKVASQSINAVEGEPYYARIRPTTPIEFAPQNTYMLTAQNTPAPVPNSLDLTSATDSGISNTDDITKNPNAVIQLKVDPAGLANMLVQSTPTPDTNFANDPPGWKISVYTNDLLSGVASQVGPGLFAFNYGTNVLPGAQPLSEGDNQITAAVTIVGAANVCGLTPSIHCVGDGTRSAALLVRLDTTAPAPPSVPDLLAASDTGGVNDDDITTLTAPQFGGTGEAEAHLRIFSDGVLSGQTDVTTIGEYQVTIVPQGDGVYDITATLEDAAGNVSPLSGALKVTIANQGLTLPGATASGLPSGAVTVDLSANTIDGYPGIPGISGKIGIANIPVVTMDVGSNELNILGTASDDTINYTPTGAGAGTLTRQGSSQALHFSNVMNRVSVDPLGGTDALNVIGNGAANTVIADTQATTTVTVDSLLPLQTPIANVEQLGISSLGGKDAITVKTYDSVNAYLTVDGGPPVTNPQKGDSLTVQNMSPKPKIQTQPGGSGAGSIIVSYPQTTDNITRIDFQSIEKTPVIKKM